MKSIKYIIILALVLFGAAYISKPSDKECLSKMATETVGNKYVSDIISDNVVFTTTLEVQDHIFYKTINIRFVDKKIATCIFGKVFIHDITKD